MSRASEAALQDLRLRYRTAHSAYQACVRAVTEATMSGAMPSAALLEQEAKALIALKELRSQLLARMAEPEGAEEPSTGQPG